MSCIVVASDGSESADRAVDYAAQRAKESAAPYAARTSRWGRYTDHT